MSTKTTVQHTPGPWRIESKYTVKGPDGSRIVDTWKPPLHPFAKNPSYPEGEIARCKANARLIAAAPVMLEALKAIYASVVYPACERCNSQFAIDGNVARLLREAIALAEPGNGP